MFQVFSLAAVVFLFGCIDRNSGGETTVSNLSESHVVYGEDGRKDFFEIDDPALIEISRSTAVFIETEHLQADQQNDSYRLKHEPAKLNMCPGEKFIEQPQWGFCTGTLVAADVILTAGHCIENHKECLHTKIVFDYRLQDKDQEIKSVRSQQVFSCREIIYRVDETKGADFALIKLDRPVNNRPFLKLSHSEVTFQDQLLVIGYPLGLPLKFTFGGKARRLLDDKFFVATLDTFSGNSGSAVFNQETLEIVGVLSRGEKDFERQNSCHIAKVCHGENCRGEDVTRASEIKKKMIH